MIDNSTQQRIKAMANIVDVVGDFVQLRKRGAEWEGLCPFHDDRHLGSFRVSPAKNICTCFSCQKTLDPVGFIMEITKCSYIDALHWLGKKYGISTDGSSTDLRAVVPVKRQEKPMLVVPNNIVAGTMKMARKAMLCQWLHSLPWQPEQAADVDRVIWLYAVGYWQGRVVFWQVDEKGQVRSGKLMEYAQDGHRVQDSNPGWIHNQPQLRALLGTDGKSFHSCLFGLHLATRYPSATVNIVESEKTALVCAIAYGDWERNIWLASGGKKALRREQLQPLIETGRKILLWPDKDGVDEWAAFARSIGTEVQVYTDFLERDWCEEDGAKADIADIIIRRLSEMPKTDDELKQQMIDSNPHLGDLLEELQHIETNGGEPNN